MYQIWQDLKYAGRMLRKNPGFTFVAVLTLALGIGANTAIFSVVESVLLRPLPYKNPRNSSRGLEHVFSHSAANRISGADFENWRQQAELLRDGGLPIRWPRLQSHGEGEPERLEATYATSNLFSLLGVRPAAGHTFGREEDKPGSPPVVVISHRVWQSRFGSDPSAIGRVLNLDGNGYTLIGVLPVDFHLVPWADLWLPVGQMDPGELTGRVFIRLA